MDEGGGITIIENITKRILQLSGCYVGGGLLSDSPENQQLN